jgi:hypothetical protein
VRHLEMKLDKRELTNEGRPHVLSHTPGIAFLPTTLDPMRRLLSVGFPIDHKDAS